MRTGSSPVRGRTDNLLVTPMGRNISPEWIESLLLADPRVAYCIVTYIEGPYLSAILVPTPQGERWFERASAEEITALIAGCCCDAPAYAIPRRYFVVRAERTCPLWPVDRQWPHSAEGFARGIRERTRIQRTAAGKSIALKECRAMTFHDRLLAETAAARAEFLSIPILGRALEGSVPRALYIEFLRQAYHHVRHTCPLLSLAAARTQDSGYRASLYTYIEEERGHEEWILSDIAAMGGDVEGTWARRRARACRAMVGYAYYAIEWISPYALLGMVHVLEGMSAQLAANAAGSLEKIHRSGRRPRIPLSHLPWRTRRRPCRVLQKTRERAS